MTIISDHRITSSVDISDHNISFTSVMSQETMRALTSSKRETVSSFIGATHDFKVKRWVLNPILSELISEQWHNRLSQSRTRGILCLKINF